MGGCTPAGPGNPTPQDDSVRPFDFAAHMAGLIIYALDDPSKAGAVGWLCAFAGGPDHRVTLAELSAAHQRQPQGNWPKDADPRGLMAAIPVFGIERGDDILTEPQELMGIDWASPDLRFAMFDAMADHFSMVRERAPVYLKLLTEWHQNAPQPGLDRIIRMYALLYNEGLYMEAYKLLEMRWMAETQNDKKEFLRGLMQLAVGLHQIQGGKFAMQQLEEAYGRIRTHKAVFGYNTIDRFIKRLEKATRLIKSYGPDGYQKFDLRMFPKIWFKNPWKQLFSFGK